MTGKLVVYINPDIIATKPVEWLGDSRRRARALPSEARRQVGHELWAVQQGKQPSDWRPIPTIGSGVEEIRIHAEGEHRVVYIAKFAEAVYVLHVFSKKTRRTRQLDIDVACARLRRLVAEKRGQ
jgi:phage-related protein